ncbi:MAG: adenine phosphoribosyltransferase [Myxococcota bacterium]
MSTPLDLRRFVRNVPDFPSPGILFRDVTPLLANPDALREAVARVAEPFRGAGVEQVLGVESRGFILGAPVALQLGAGLCIARKPGKLPAKTHEVSYELEYGTDRLEMHTDSLVPGQRVLIVDDLLATGGTAAATLRLAQLAGSEVLGCSFLIELEALGGRGQLPAKEIHSVITY